MMVELQTFSRQPDSFWMALHRGFFDLRMKERGLRFDRLAVTARHGLRLFSGGGFDRLDLSLAEPFKALRAGVRVEHVIKHQSRIVIETLPIWVAFFESGLRIFDPFEIRREFTHAQTGTMKAFAATDAPLDFTQIFVQAVRRVFAEVG